MSHNSQAFLPTNAGLPPSHETLKEEYGVTELGEPKNSAVVRTMVINMPREVSMPDHVVWSLFNALFFNACCLGFSAYAYSVTSRNREMVGDVIGVQTYAATAKCLNSSSLTVIALTVIICIITLSTTSVVVCQSFSQRTPHSGF